MARFEDPSVIFGRDEVLPNYYLLSVYRRLDPDATVAELMARVTETTIEAQDSIEYEINPAVATAAAISRLEELELGG
jgi:phage terminase large subunit-like protein